MIRTFSLSLLLLPILSIAQLNMALVGTLSYRDLRNSDISDIWGYVDEQGNEYALVGVNGGGVSVVSLVDPTNPVEVFYYPGPGSIWRDLKVWNDHAYVTTEGGGGLAIVDLSPLPESTALSAQSWIGEGWSSAHNLYIDENGVAYISGADRGNGGVIFLDLNGDPFQPVEIGEFDNWYSHDCMVRGDTMYAAHISNGFFSVVDVSNKQAPVLLGTQFTGNDFAHNCWVSDDGNYLFTTDEVTGGWLGSYDISDPTDIQELQLFRSDPGSGTIPHNTHYINGYLVTSYYRLGTVIHDASRPWNMVEVGRYDHCELVGDNYNGGWGTYPWLPSGRIISSDIEEGLIVLDPTYVRACWLEGLVSDATNSAPINGASVVLSAPSLEDLTGFDGRYATGSHLAGEHSVTVSAPGYQSQTVPVSLSNGELTVLDVALQPLQVLALAGEVRDEVTAAGIPDARVQFTSNGLAYNTLAAADGGFQLPAVFAGSYASRAGRWGWRTRCEEGVELSPGMGPYVVELEQGYMDDMALDLGWTVSGTATAGGWERGVPEATALNGALANPAGDADGDCGGEAYVTGILAGSSAGEHDVDGGYTELRSPTFDVSGMIEPAVRYQRWFFNGGGQGAPNDRLVISLSNGNTTADVETVTTSGSAWQEVTIPIADHLAPTANMRFVARASDDAPGHLVEAGIDRFEVIDLSSLNVAVQPDAQLLVWPNPSTGTVNIQAPSGRYELTLSDVAGRVVQRSQVVMQTGQAVEMRLPPGVYLMMLEGEGLDLLPRKVVVH
ncbi:MAG: choice-of-anchor B family protein [Flavobacteriales bacterium]